MLAIIVVLYNSEADVRPFWKNLVHQTHAEFRLIAIDNPAGGGDDAADYLEHAEDPRIAVIRNKENVGFARAVNQGLRQGYEQGCDRFLLLNPDTLFDPNFLQQLDAVWTGSSAPVIAPRVMYANDPSAAYYAGGHFDYGYVFTPRHDPYSEGVNIKTVEYASGCCLGITRAVLEKVGLLDESFFVYFEDADLCLRLQSFGYSIYYVEHPYLLHKSGASSGGEFSPAATLLYYKSYAQFSRKHFGLPTTLRNVLRIVRIEAARPGKPPGHPGRVLRALAQGLLSQLRPMPRLVPAAIHGSGTILGQNTSD